MLFCFVWQHRSFSFIFPLFSLFITQTFLYWQSPSSIWKCDCQLSYFGISCMKFQYSNKYSVQFDVQFSLLARNVIVLLVNLGFLTCFNSSVKFPRIFQSPKRKHWTSAKTRLARAFSSLNLPPQIFQLCIVNVRNKYLFWRF